MCHSVEDVRVLRGDDVVAIVRGTPRSLGRCVLVVVGHEALADHVAPGLGQGLLCALKEPHCTHVVSVFRCGDGRFLYYDPKLRSVYPAFDAFCRLNAIGAAHVTVVQAAFQRPGFRTCAYHALTFLDYVTRLNQQDSWLTLASFRRHMGRNTDLKAIKTVRGLLREFPNSISLSTTLTPGANPVFVPPAPSPPPSTPPNTSSLIAHSLTARPSPSLPYLPHHNTIPKPYKTLTIVRPAPPPPPRPT